MKLDEHKLVATTNVHLLSNDKRRAKVIGNFRASNITAIRYLADEICTRIEQIDDTKKDMHGLKSLIIHQMLRTLAFLDCKYPIEGSASFTLTYMNISLDMTIEVVDDDFEDIQVTIDGFGNIHF